MMASVLSRLQRAWRATSRADRVAIGVAAVYGVDEALRSRGGGLPFSGFIGFAFLLAFAYGAIRLFVFLRRHLLWSLRNRLIVAYLFIAVVPILLLIIMAGLSAFIVYSQLGAYLLNRDVQARLAALESLGDAVMTASPSGGRDYPGAAGAPEDSVSRLLAARAEDFPGLNVHWGAVDDGIALGPEESDHKRRFTGLFQQEDKVWLRAVIYRGGAAGKNSAAQAVSLSVPLGAELLERLAPQLGVIQLNVLQPSPAGLPADRKEIDLPLGGKVFRRVAQISTVQRNLAAPAGWWDYEVSGVSRLESRALEKEGAQEISVPIFVSFSARPSQLSRHLFSSLGDMSSLPFVFLLVIGGMFLVIEAGALFVGVRMTQSITGSVADLYRATQHVQEGDFSYRIRSERKDQLGELGNSFNAMTVSVASAMEEQRRRERLENELAIAHEVQSQLFPRERPRLPGLELAAECRAARTVSGDYYDFIPLSATELGLIVADIAGKGISAALLMASLQAALRSQFLEKGSGAKSTAEVVKRLNRHLFVASPDDRYATLFFAIYNSASRVMRYTNAGHLPPMCFAPEGIIKLEDGGTVVGMFEECEYDQGRITIAPGSLLMLYTDGLVEPENAYGEEFGRKRLTAEVVRHRHAGLDFIAQAVMGAVEDWAGTPERSDDMTMVLASVS